MDVRFLVLENKPRKKIKRYQYTAIDDATPVRASKVYTRHTQKNAIAFVDHIIVNMTGECPGGRTYYTGAMLFYGLPIGYLNETDLSTKHFPDCPLTDCPVAHSLDSKTRYLEVLHEFALSQVDLNSLDEILWNVAKTAIAELGFVDCVIYLLDDDGSKLIQRAAHGPKNPEHWEIFDPITITLGDGIVGAVAETGQVELISDTREDSRYIVDDAQRLSELAVPIIHDGRVIGVLDSEHPEVGFFTDDHVRLLTTIASLAATRIDTALAMENLHLTIERLSIAEKSLEKKAGELEKAKIEADRASVEKSQFLANMSHEIRTPMTAVLGYIELLTQAGKSDSDKAEWVDQIHLNTNHLLGLVNDVLDLSRIESGELRSNIRSCRHDKLIADVVTLMKPRVEEADLTFNISVAEDLPAIILTDPLRLQQALMNLLSNAIKYTEKGSISLQVSSKQEPDSEKLDTYYQVSDTGIGIKAEEIAGVLEPFVRADDPKRNIAGAGLGLAIVCNITKMLDGKIEVESEPGRGSTFRLRIPTDAVCDTTDAADDTPRSSEYRTGAQEIVPNQLEGCKIHIVEDSLAIATVIRLLLEEAGAVVQHSANGAIGVKHILKSRDRGDLPDLVIMDMQMPVKDGYTAAAELRKDGIEVPIIAMTAAAFMEDREKCLAAGCNAYLSKPVDPANFAKQISDCITGDRSEKGL